MPAQGEWSVYAYNLNARRHMQFAGADVDYHLLLSEIGRRTQIIEHR